jgi:hypothetical protein
MKMLLIALLLCPPMITAADDAQNVPPVVQITEEQKVMNQLYALDKFRMYMGDPESREVFYRSIAEASLETLERCQMKGGEDCLVLINFIQRAKPTKSSYCYSILISGYMCEYHKDLRACAYYKPRKEECKALINERDK